MKNYIFKISIALEFENVNFLIGYMNWFKGMLLHSFIIMDAILQINYLCYPRRSPNLVHPLLDVHNLVVVPFLILICTLQ